MDQGREECCTGASSGTVVEGGDSSSDHDFYCEEKSGRQQCRRITSSSMLPQWLSCIIIFLALGGLGRNQGIGFATARITLPVIRSFSQMKGSGKAEGESGGMTREHAQQLRDHDSQRHLRLHGRSLTSTTVADFPLSGNDYEIGLYFTEIELGTPSSKYYVQVDTGSDLLWVNCKPCPSCPTSSDLNIPLRLYNPGSSSTSSNTTCTSELCNEATNIADSYCEDDSCYYSFKYGDGSSAMGYLVQDAITYDTGISASNSSQYVQASAKVTFGCGFNQTGESLTTSQQATDGIMGFGQAPLSVVTQLAQQGFTTYEFAHCLQGDTGSGGIFVIGDVQASGIVYTDIIQHLFHYNVALQSISMDGTTLSIPASAFDTDPNNADTGTIFDSGTTMAIIVDEAYEAFKEELIAVAPVTAEYLKGQEDQPCFQYDSGELDANFPTVTLHFAGTGAAMNLVPTNYLYNEQNSNTDSSLWCVGWSRSSASGLDGLTILGDIVLKNKLVVYDLSKERIGWVGYNCLSNISVSNGTADEVLNPTSASGSHYLQAYHPLAVLICLVVFMYAAAFL